MKILLTGVSSFTGFWFAKALATAGHGVVATLTRPVAAYSGIRKRRIEDIGGHVAMAPEVTFGSPQFADLLKREGPFDLLCHHAAEVTNYNDPGFDALGALANNVANLPSTLAQFRAVGGRGVVLTGSVFEANEGAGDEPLRAFNPYGLSKTLTAEYFSYHVPAAGLRFGKFVIPNPVGPLEEPRFTAYLMKTWRESKTASVKTPDYIRDNVPVDLLAACYRLFAERVHDSAVPFLRLNPSGYVESQGAFAQRFATEMRSRLNLDCAVKLETQTDFSQPTKRVNTDPACNLVPNWDANAFWSAYASYYRG